jgi:MFS family permease
MALLASGYGLLLMVSVALMPSIPAMAIHFGSVALAQLILISPVALKIVGGPAAAWLMQQFGRRRPLLGNLLILGIAAALSIAFDAFWVQLALRLCMGFAAAAIATISTTLVGDYFEGAQRDRALSWTGIAPMLGSVLGLFGGGLIAQMWGWQWANALLLLAFPVWLGALIFLPEPRLAATANGSGAATATAPLPTSLLHFLGIAALTTIICVFGGYQLPLLITELGINSASFTGTVLALSSVGAACAAALYPKLRARLGLAGVFIWIMLSSSTIYALLSLGAGKLWVGGVAALMGLGAGLLYPFCTGWAIEHASTAARPRTVGFIMSAIFAGQISCPFLAEIVRGTFGARVAFACAAALALVAAMFAVAFKQRVFAARIEAAPS